MGQKTLRLQRGASGSAQQPSVHSCCKNCSDPQGLPEPPNGHPGPVSWHRPAWPPRKPGVPASGNGNPHQAPARCSTRLSRNFPSAEAVPSPRKDVRENSSHAASSYRSSGIHCSRHHFRSGNQSCSLPFFFLPFSLSLLLEFSSNSIVPTVSSIN